MGSGSGDSMGVVCLKPGTMRSSASDVSVEKPFQSGHFGSESSEVESSSFGQSWQNECLSFSFADDVAVEGFALFFCS